jgi:choline dehydrogenase-like flavoprotein
MFEQAHQSDPSQGVVNTDICVVGGGAAGIALGMELVEGPAQVVVVEAGGIAPGPDDRGVYEVVPGSPPGLRHDLTKPWYFGGNTNYWFANCRPLDALDFERRDWIAGSGWPIGLGELLPYYERAQAICGLGDFRWYDADTCRPHLERPLLDAASGGVLETRIVQTCPVPSLADLHRDSLDASTNVRIMLGTRALALKTDATGSRVVAVDAARADGRPVRIQADVFVLAAGGIENPRLLLNSTEVSRRGLGNDDDLVGRFFMEHWFFDLGLGDWRRDDLELYQGQRTREALQEGLQAVGDASVWGQLALSAEAAKRERVPGLSLWFAPSRADTPSVVGARRVAKSLARRSRSEQGLTDLRLALTGLDDVALHLFRKARRGPTSGYTLRLQIEQTPDADNRIRLSSARDRFGVPRPDLDVRLQAGVRKDHLRAARIAADSLDMNGSRLARQFDLMIGAGRFGFFWHHMGTTRMSDRPAEGVVDRNCRVHGVANLFVTGSSVFPTGGTAAPTLTIVALAVRLADHIRTRPQPTPDAGSV